MTDLVGAAWVKRLEFFELLTAILHLAKLGNLEVERLYLSLKLDRHEPNQCIILSCHALL